MALGYSQLGDLCSLVVEIQREDITGFYDSLRGDLCFASGEDVLERVDVPGVGYDSGWVATLCGVIHEVPEGGLPPLVEGVVGFSSRDLLVGIIVVAAEGFGVAFHRLAGEVSYVPRAESMGGDYLRVGVLGDNLRCVLGAIEVAGEDVGDSGVFQLGSRLVGTVYPFVVEGDVGPAAEFLSLVWAGAGVGVGFSMPYDVESIGHLGSQDPSR